MGTDKKTSKSVDRVAEDQRRPNGDSGAKTLPTPEVSIVLPALDEAESLARILDAIAEALAPLASFEVVVVDDGSGDGTLQYLIERAESDESLRYVSLSRNFGHQAALRAGLAFSRGACVICMDADGQHPPGLLPEMVQAWRDGHDVVLMIREEDPEVPAIKRLTSRLFYGVMNKISDLEIEAGSADFRLFDRRVVDVTNNLAEPEIFFRGLVPWLGFESKRIPFRPEPRRFGQSKYSLGKMMALALSGMIAFSVAPLRLSIIFSVIFAVFGFGFGLYAIYIALFTNAGVSGWASLTVMVCFLGSTQLLMLGILGEYLGRILRLSLNRPGFIVQTTNCQDPND
jgi:glycosyltransferase involved in cell wall biosynthesis